jgi:hypothetical protein
MRFKEILNVSLNLENIDKAITNDIRVLKTLLVTKRPKLLLVYGENKSLYERVEREDELQYEQIKKALMSGQNVVSMVAKINEKAKSTSKDAKMYTSKKI